MNAPSELDRDLFPDTQAFQSAQEAWEGGTKEAQDPIGTFTGTILSAALGRAQSSGRLQISYEIEITTPGEYTGRKLRKYAGLETPQQAKMTQQELKRLGINAAGLTIATLPAALLGLIGVSIVFAGKQNGQYYNLNFQKRVDATAGTGVTGFAAAANTNARSSTGTPTGKSF
jgi:hypothetical protein